MLMLPKFTVKFSVVLISTVPQQAHRLTFCGKVISRRTEERRRELQQGPPHTGSGGTMTDGKFGMRACVFLQTRQLEGDHLQCSTARGKARSE